VISTHKSSYSSHRLSDMSAADVDKTISISVGKSTCDDAVYPLTAQTVWKKRIFALSGHAPVKYNVGRDRVEVLAGSIGKPGKFQTKMLVRQCMGKIGCVFCLHDQNNEMRSLMHKYRRATLHPYEIFLQGISINDSLHNEASFCFELR